LEEEIKIYFMQDLVLNPNEDGDAIRAVEFFDASKEEQLAIFESWAIELKAVRRESLEAERASLEARLAELNS
jgi:hypothetical protein